MVVTETQFNHIDDMIFRILGKHSSIQVCNHISYALHQFLKAKSFTVEKNEIMDFVADVMLNQMEYTEHNLVMQETWKECFDANVWYQELHTELTKYLDTI